MTAILIMVIAQRLVRQTSSSQRQRSVLKRSSSLSICIFIREGVKYYFADFVRKGGTPPFTEKFFVKKSYGFGGFPPPSPFTDTPPKNVLQKC